MTITPQMRVKIVTLLFFFAAVGYAISYVTFGRDRPLGESYKQVSEYGGDFTLATDKGKLSLSDLKGKVVVVYFGFMNCTEACPLSMAKMRTMARRLAPEELEQVQGAFITIDPERDSNAEELNAFVRNYHPSFIGLTGSPEEITRVSEQYGVYAKPEDFEGDSATYTVDHSSRFYMIGKDGELLTTMSHSTTPAELVAKVRTML
ncbi:MAG: electron transporter [Gammaproteobacteria bacterium]|nr:MAG: electron transporter [Gammaproteobacteria bacterium]